MSKNEIGSVSWHDLTVTMADDIKNFYESVVGWDSRPVSMGEYLDYSMQSPTTGDDQVGICHARGANADLPAQWLMYILVEDVDKSIAAVEKQGGCCVTEIKHFSATSRYVVIQDPAGAVCAIYDEK
ncbi:VOC family protein [Alteromonadaceae bacterium BrNp21-10]|nr:VOC family protein [Alteromonadaceae bacterium BrNp21-10]